MPFLPFTKKKVGVQYSPWIVVGAATILLCVVVTLAVQNINREKRYMSRILREKGAALIKAVEAGTRTGVMCMMWGEHQIQRLLEETASQADILYLAVTDKTGLILAHSDRSRIGEKFRKDFLMDGLHPSPHENWRLKDNGEGQRAFEVYRYFRPLAKHRMSCGNCSNRMAGSGRMPGRELWCFFVNPEQCEQLIFVGLDPAPFEDARWEDTRNTVIISAVLALLGWGGVLSLFWAESYRRARRMLQDTSAFANEVVTNLPVGLIASDRNGDIAFFNAAAEKITGFYFNDVRGKATADVIPSPWCDMQPLLDQGRTVLEQEMECTLPDGKAVPLSVSAARIVNEDGDFVGKILILRDLGEVRKLQEEIRRKEKLAAVGGLAAGVAHEIRNPLSSIKGLASYFGGKFAKGSEDKEAAEVMIREVDRLNRVVSELLDFARPSDLSLKTHNINQVLEHSLRLVHQDARVRQIETFFSAHDGLPPVTLDADRFSQCLLNLYLNAIQAMDEGGLLSVRSSFSSDRKMIQIEIEDTGKGIGPDDIGKIFDPYFTSKPSGTGLGLAIVHKIVEAHHGSVKVKSTPAKGTVFTLLIPIHNDDMRQV